jgi:amidohydrolase
VSAGRDTGPTGANKAGFANAVSAKAGARQVVDRRAQDLIALADDIHDHPELLFAEHHAARAVADALETAGLQVSIGDYGLETAVVGRSGSGPLHVVVCAEYDALPGVGHACGHNIIAAAAVGAGAALAAVADEVGLTVTVLGTPAEEGGGGKILMLERGAFAGAHAAMMVHPWPEDRLVPQCLAVDHIEVSYTGRSAHASAAPEQGINAADALTIAQVAIGLLRQHFAPGNQIHGIVTEGGDAPNVVPSHARGRFMMRARTIEDLAVLRPRIERCFEAGAIATGSALAITDLAPPYSHMVTDPALIGCWRRNAEALGRWYPAEDAGAPPPMFSTDMANVSLALPSIHPLVGIDTAGAVNHQPEFAAACVGASANRALLDGAISMAWTAIDAATVPEIREALLSGSR